MSRAQLQHKPTGPLPSQSTEIRTRSNEPVQHKSFLVPIISAGQAPRENTAACTRRGAIGKTTPIHGRSVVLGISLVVGLKPLAYKGGTMPFCLSLMGQTLCRVRKRYRYSSKHDNCSGARAAPRV